MNDIEKALMHALFVHLHHNIDKAIDFKAIDALNKKVGKLFPGSLVVGPGDDAAAFNETGVAFGTVALPERKMGGAAVTMLLEKISQPGRPLPSIALPTTFSPGRTCAPIGELPSR